MASAATLCVLAGQLLPDLKEVIDWSKITDVHVGKLRDFNTAAEEFSKVLTSAQVADVNVSRAFHDLHDGFEALAAFNRRAEAYGCGEG